MVFSSLKNWFSNDQDLHLKGYNVQELNCVYTKKGENKVLLLARSEKLAHQPILERYKSQAAAVVGCGAYLRRKDSPINPNFSELEDSLFSRFTETSLFGIARGKYDALLSSIASSIIKPGDYIHLRWGVVSEDLGSLLKLLSPQHPVFDRYWSGLKLTWGLNIGISDGKPADLKFVLKNIMTLQDNLASIPGQKKGDLEECPEIVKKLYRAGLTRLYQKIPVKPDFILEEVLHQLHDQLSLRLINDQHRWWYSEGDQGLELALKSKTN